MQPLAERLRPQTLDEYIGQKHLVGEGAVEQGILLNSSSCPMVPLMPASGIHRRMHRKTNSTNA